MNKLDSRINTASNKLHSDLDQFLHRAEQVKQKLQAPSSSPIPVQNNATCAMFYANISECYSKNKDEVFKCQNVIKAFTNAVDQNQRYKVE